MQLIIPWIHQHRNHQFQQKQSQETPRHGIFDSLASISSPTSRESIEESFPCYDYEPNEWDDSTIMSTESFKMSLPSNNETTVLHNCGVPSAILISVRHRNSLPSTSTNDDKSCEEGIKTLGPEDKIDLPFVSIEGRVVMLSHKNSTSRQHDRLRFIHI